MTYKVTVIQPDSHGRLTTDEYSHSDLYTDGDPQDLIRLTYSALRGMTYSHIQTLELFLNFLQEEVPLTEEEKIDPQDYAS